MEQEIQYSIGEWIVHSQHGVGQIKKIETMPLHGKQTECFKVQVKGGTFWFPTNSTETSPDSPNRFPRNHYKDDKKSATETRKFRKRQEILESKN